MAENIFKRIGQFWDHLVNGKQGDTASSSKPFYVDPMKPVNLMASDEDRDVDEWMDEWAESSRRNDIDPSSDPSYSFLPNNLFHTD